MYCSPVALTLQTSQLVQQFNDDDFLTFRKSVLAELNCNNEKEFFQKVLVFSQSHLPIQTTTNIYNSACNISMKSNYPSPIIPKNVFSSLSSNIIQSIGSYVTKNDCINLGYSNRHLYIETQNKTFILNRRNSLDELVTIDRKSIDILQNKKGNMISYPFHFPYGIDFGGVIKCANKAFDDYDKSIYKSDINVVEQDSNNINGQNVKNIISNNLHLQNVFKYAQCIKILPSWSYAIPIDQLFDDNNNKQQLSIFFPIVDTPVLEQFLKNYKKYCKDTENNNNTSMKMIDNLIIENVNCRKINPIRTDHPGNGKIKQKATNFEVRNRGGGRSVRKSNYVPLGVYTKKFFGSLNTNFKKLHIYSGTVFIDNFEYLSSIFHCNLESLILGYPTINYILNKHFLHGTIEFSIDIKSKNKNIIRGTDGTSNDNDKSDVTVGDGNEFEISIPQKFKYLGVCLYHSYLYGFDDTHLWMNKFWTNMNKLSMFKYLKTISLQFDDTHTISQCLNYENGWLTNELKKNKNNNSSSIPNLSHVIIGIKNDFYGLPKGRSTRAHYRHTVNVVSDLTLRSFTTDDQYIGQRFFMTSLVFKHYCDICQNGLFKSASTKSSLTKSNLSKVTLKLFFQCDSDCFATKNSGEQTNGRLRFLQCKTVNHDGHNTDGEQDAQDGKVEDGVEDHKKYDDGYVVYINSLANSSIIQSHFKPICQWIVESMRKDEIRNHKPSTADFKVKFVAV